jgi:large subunit ribosomal protein L21
VAPGQTIRVERLDVPEGNTVELDRVLLVSDGDKVTVGTPAIDGVKVLATSAGEGRGKKVTVFKYKRKTRSQKKTGHRQAYTTLTIDRIFGPGTSESKPARKARPRKKKEVIEDGP